jgi:hypothetical protein
MTSQPKPASITPTLNATVPVQVQDLPWLGDRFGQWAQRSGLMQGPVRPMFVVERLEVAQGVEQMALVPDEGAVQ